MNIKYDELESGILDNLIKERKSFEVVGVKSMSYAVGQVEHAIESNGLKCRVYTAKRAASLALLNPITFSLGVASAIGIGIHNAATYNPDYEIKKHPIDNRLEVVCKR